jgi:hypothetical protein
MSVNSENPVVRFTEELVDFARGGRRGIRNPFVMVPVDPPVEHRVTDILQRWAGTGTEPRLEDWRAARTEKGESVKVVPIRLDALLPRTTAFETAIDLGPLDRVSTESVQETLERNLASELIERLMTEHLNDDGPPNQQHTVLLLLNLGSLYPFTRASELLDEIDRRNVNTTVGIPFPGSVIGGRLSFFNEQARHYYPAHRIDTQIEEGYITDA